MTNATMKNRLAKLEAIAEKEKPMERHVCTPEEAEEAYRQFMQDNGRTRLADFPTVPNEAAAAYVRLVKGERGRSWRG